MKYTKENIPEGTMFTTQTEAFRLKNIRPEEDKCHLVPTDGKSVEQPNYPLHIVVESFNDGTWTVQEEIYQIY